MGKNVFLVIKIIILKNFIFYIKMIIIYYFYQIGSNMHYIWLDMDNMVNKKYIIPRFWP